MNAAPYGPHEPWTDLDSLSLPALFAELSRDGLVRRLLELARDEDLGPGLVRGDVTTLATEPATDRVTARLVCRSGGVMAGLQAVPLLIEVFGGTCSFEERAHDGAHVARGAVLGVLSGPARDALALERTLLNLVGRLSGVATLTAAYVRALADGAPGTRARVYDTRKTTPGLRMLEKYAVRCGGGESHRVGLYDAVLIKDNHLAGLGAQELATWVADAARRARTLRPLRFVEVETDTLDQARAILSIEPGLVDVLLLDNMGPPALAQAVRLRDEHAPTLLLEASGGVSLQTIGAIGATGVDRISVGALTHQATSIDLGLDVP